MLITMKDAANIKPSIFFKLWNKKWVNVYVKNIEVTFFKSEEKLNEMNEKKFKSNWKNISTP